MVENTLMVATLRAKCCGSANAAVDFHLNFKSMFVTLKLFRYSKRKLN